MGSYFRWHGMIQLLFLIEHLPISLLSTPLHASNSSPNLDYIVKKIIIKCSLVQGDDLIIQPCCTSLINYAVLPAVFHLRE